MASADELEDEVSSDGSLEEWSSSEEGGVGKVGRCLGSRRSIQAPGCMGEGSSDEDSETPSALLASVIMLSDRRES